MNPEIYPADLATLHRAIDTRLSRATGPLIGVSANHEGGDSRVEDSYLRSIAEAGGIPVILPMLADIETLRALVEPLDGLLLSGGGDIDPLYSGEEPLPGLGAIDLPRDQYDFTLVKLAADRCIPIFGICRGMQIINMAFGGTNYQDIYSQHDGITLKHSQSISREHGSHSVQILPGSVLHQIMGTDRLVVNSFHHQAIRQVAPGFRATATAPDGIVEAIEGMPARPILGVQWHPEKMAVRPDEQMQRLFRHFTSEAALFARAKAFHRTHLVLDSHCDTPMKFTPDFDFALRHEDVKVDLPKMQEGLEDAVFMVAYLEQGPRDEASLRAATEKAVNLLFQIAEQAKHHPRQVAIAYTADDLPSLKAAGKKAIFLGIENGYAIGKDIANLTLFKQMGVTYITLCHNGDNDLCDSARGSGEHGGLSPFGREVVREMNRLGLLIDLSHAADSTVNDVLETSAAPVIASHSSCRALCPHPRNLTDEHIRAIAAKGGVVQICLYGPFLRDDGSATVLDAADHIDHAVRLAGIDHVGIGTDFDGDDTEVLPGCRAANELPNLTVELLRRGYSEAQLAKLWGGNLLRVLNAIQAQPSEI